MTPPARAIPLSLEVFGLGSQAGLVPIGLKQFTTLEFPPALRLLAVAVLALLGLWVAGPWGEARLEVPGLPKRKSCLALMLLLPLALLWLGSFVKPLYAVGRYDLVAFPAFTWLLGLALWKLQRVPRAGPLWAALAALLLLLPIGTKLWRYYEAASGWDMRPAAEVLYAGAADGDVVVFTGLRGLPVLYYMSRLGFQLDEQHGRVDMPGRQVAYRMYPRNSERTLAISDARRVLDSPDALREDVQDYVAALRPQQGTLWVVFERGIISRKAVGVSKVDALLVQELRTQGFHALPVEGAPGILRFQRGG